jgi:hypothetical protein
VRWRGRAFRTSPISSRPPPNWSDWAVEFRYPSERQPPEPEDEELRRALAVIDALAARLRAAARPPE